MFATGMDQIEENDTNNFLDDNSAPYIPSNDESVIQIESFKQQMLQRSYKTLKRPSRVR
jgi:hypothetical protein